MGLAVPFTLFKKWRGWDPARMRKEHDGPAESVALAALLSSDPLFKEMDAAQLSRIAPAVQFKEFKNEEIVCHCPDAQHDAFLLLEGIVAAT